MANILYLRHF